MAFPSIVASASNRNTANGTSLTVNLPNGSDTVGRRIVVAFTIDNQQTVTFPGGWNSLGSADGPSGNSRLYVYYHDVDGTEGYPSTGATITVTVVTSDGFSHVAHLIEVGTFDAGTAPEIQFATQASTGTDPNPPSITPTGGAKDYLFLAYAGVDGTNGAPTFSGFPTNYSLNQVSIASGFTGGTSTGGAGRQLNTAGPEDPSAFTLSGAEQREAATVVIHPVAAGTTLSPGVGGVTLAGLAPTFQLPINLQPGVGGVTLAGFSPTFQLPITFRPGVGGLQIAGFAPTFDVSVAFRPGVGGLQLAGFAPTFQTPVTLRPGLGGLTLAGLAPTFQTPVTLRPGVGGVTLAGLAPTFQSPVTIRPGVGGLTLAGFAPSLQLPVTLRPGRASLTITGYAPTFDTPGGSTPARRGGGFRRILYDPAGAQREIDARPDWSPDDLPLEAKPLPGLEPLPERRTAPSPEIRLPKRTAEATVVIVDDDDEIDFILNIVLDLD